MKVVIFKKKFIITLLAILVLCGGTNSQATVIDSGSTYNFNSTDWVVAYDQTNDLYWLALGATENTTVDAIAASGLMSDWQFATLSQVRAFYNSISPGLGNDPHSGLVEDALVDLWAFWPGVVREDTTSARYIGLVADDPYAPSDAGAVGFYQVSTPLHTADSGAIRRPPGLTQV